MRPVPRDRPRAVPRAVLVEGRSGAGKTTLAAALGAALDAPVVHLDDLYPGWDGLAAGAARLADDVLPAWRAGRAARLRRWDWDACAWSGADEELVVAPGPLLVVEGVGAGAADLAAGDVLVWAQAPDDVRRRRALARDGEAYAPHWDRWAAQEEAHLRSHAPAARADVVVVTG